MKRSDIPTMLRAVIRAAINTGAACQKAKSFIAAEPGKPLRSVHDVMFDQAINVLRDTTTAKMDEAIRIGCRAADVHRDCSYPACSCQKIPAAVKAAVGFAILDAVKEIRHG